MDNLGIFRGYILLRLGNLREQVIQTVSRNFPSGVIAASGRPVQNIILAYLIGRSGKLLIEG
jgi:hypothetical protein